MGESRGGEGRPPGGRPVIKLTPIHTGVAGLEVWRIDRPCGCTEVAHVATNAKRRHFLSTYTLETADLVSCGICGRRTPSGSTLVDQEVLAP